MMNENPSYSILIIDDHPLFRKGLMQLFENEQGFTIAGECASGQDGIQLAKEIKPDLILLDLNMKEMDGIEVLKAIKNETAIDPIIIMITVSDSEVDLVTAIKNGADGYLLKDSEPEELIDKIRTAASGQIVLTDNLTGMLSRAMRDDRPIKSREEPLLTNREQEILSLIAEGLSNKKIARELGISDGTVKVHVKNLLRKLKLNSRLEAAVWALETKKK